MPVSPHALQSLAGESNPHRSNNSSLIDWAAGVVGEGSKRPASHHCLLLQQLDAISRGTIDRLMVLMPPGSAKTAYAYINSDFWGVYIATPASAGTWYAWAEGTDGSAPTVYPVPFTVT
jgi:hypothetical protein